MFETSFSGLPNLSVLNLQHNEISTLPNGIFDDLLRLRVLNLGNNHLTCMDITHLNELVDVQTIIVDGLNFSNCNEANFVHIPTVEILSISGSEISDHSLKKLRLPNNHLRHVDLSENMIESAESGILLNMTHVVSLNLSRNPLFPEPLERLLQGLKNSSIYVLKLQRLGTREERFSELRPTTFRPLNRTKLEELYFSRNNITTLSANSFVGLHRLKFLDLYDNKVGILSPDTFYGLTDLTTLKLGNNHLSDIEQVKEALKHLESLQYLDLGYNKLTEISSFAFVGVPNLVKLVLENNEISNIHRDSFGGLSNVHELDLTKNDIQDIPNDTFSALASLRILKLRHNALLSLKETHRPFRYLKNLTDLSITYSEPAAVNLHDVRTITTLEIGNDYHLPWKTHEVDASIANFTRLEILDIQRGRLIALPQMIPLRILRIADVTGAETELDFADFTKHPLLEEITVKSSNINITYGAPTIVKLPRLKTLILNQLQMTTFDTKILETAPNLETLVFRVRSLDCSCTIADFVDWMITDRKVRIDYLQDMVCETPLKRQGYFLFNVDFGNECHTAIIIAISLTCVTIVIVLSTILLVRFRWHLRHAIFLIKLKCGGYQLAVNDDSDDEPDNKYDAFVVYNEHDRDWVMGQLRPQS
ncbi:toll-like receptor 3 [Ptychodera flava]|uniref:toll-like receptor 3 n=1 Tax=Ptychodera flava TaxID=63121 RepID=UPI00396A76FB